MEKSLGSEIFFYTATFYLLTKIFFTILNEGYETVITYAIVPPL